MLIIPSKELLLVTGQQGKQLFLFDPKTSSVITKYHIESSIARTLVVYPQANQFLTTFQNKTFVNVWSTDNQEPVNKISTAELITSMSLNADHNTLFAGSQNGTLYVWQMPSGILIKKETVHSTQIRKIKQFKKSYLMTVSKQQVKIWSFCSFFIQTQRSTPIKTFNSVLQIIDVDYLRNVFIVLTSKSVTQYLGGNENAQFPQLQKDEIQYPTTLCTSMSHYYIGDVKGNIQGWQVNAESNGGASLDFQFNEEKEEIDIHKRKQTITLSCSSKHPITCMKHLKTLPFLVSGNSEGQVSIWQNHTLKKTIKLFKSSIKIMETIPRPFEDKVPQSIKIRPFAKYEQNKQTQPLQINLDVLSKNLEMQQENEHYDLAKQCQQITEQAENEIILDRILKSLSSPIDNLVGKVNRLEEQKQMLMKANLKYCEIWNQQTNN